MSNEEGDDKDTLFEVEDILEYRATDGKDFFLVKWKGYADPTWEPDEHIMEELAALKSAVKARQLKADNGKKGKKAKKEKKRHRDESSSSSASDGRSKKKKKKHKHDSWQKQLVRQQRMVQQQMMRQWQAVQYQQQMQHWQYAQYQQQMMAAEKEDKRKRAEDAKKKDEDEAKRRDEDKKRLAAKTVIMAAVDKMRTATPETFEALKAELEDAFARELKNAGSPVQQLIYEKEKALEAARKNLEGKVAEEVLAAEAPEAEAPAAAAPEAEASAAAAAPEAEAPAAAAAGD